MLLRSADGSIANAAGETLYFSPTRFEERICHGEACFICGRTRADTPFNDEHIVSDWLLHRYDLHQRTITLPNGHQHRYGTYTIPCCERCNTRLGALYEAPVSRLIAQGPAVVIEHLRTEGPGLLFTWLAIIFLKMHLKDRHLRRHLDHRLGDERIAADYDWALFHHLHCLARAHSVAAVIEPEVFGSVLCMELADDVAPERFDLVDLSAAQAMYLRLDRLGLYVVFDDGGASLGEIMNIVERVDAPPNWPQSREIIVHLAAANLRLENRPLFKTEVRDEEPPSVLITAESDGEPRFGERDPLVFGALMNSLLSQVLPRLAGPRSVEENAGLLRRGALSFLFDDQDNFIR